MIDPATKIKGSCPLNGKLCIDGIRSDFEKDADGHTHKCKWWQHIYGKDPQSEKIIDQFDCSIPWLTVTTVEGAQMSRQTSASVDKVATAVAEIKSHINSLGGAMRVAAASIAQAVEAGALTVMLPSPSDKPETNGHETRELNEGEKPHEN